jgi:REP element-mobilizing transposase RayT
MRNKFEIFVHFVWTTAGRVAVLEDEIERIVHTAVGAKCGQLNCPVIALGGTSDHVHLLVRLHPSIPAARLVGEVKGVSSRLAGLMETSAGFAWQSGYAAFSVSADDVASVASYVRNQRTHHAHSALLTELEACDDA